MVGELSLTGDPKGTNRNPSDPSALITPPGGSLKLEGPKNTCTGSNDTAAASTDNPAGENLQQEATEKSERKTLLIR